MATAKKTAQPAGKKPGTGLAKWSETLAKYAAQATAVAANTGEGVKTFSLQSGVLSLDDEQLPNNEMAVIIINAVHENAYFEEAYNSKQRTPATCFAVGEIEADLAPHATVVARGQQQAETCAECPMNQFGSAEKGRGKACGNKYRLLVIPAGSFTKQGQFVAIDEVAHYADAPAAFLKVPVTSGRNYAQFAKKLEKGLGLPPFAVVTHVKLVPDPKNQIALTFEAIEEVDAELIQALIDRHEESKELALRPLNLDVEETEAKPAARGAAKKGAPAAKKAAAKPAAKPARKY